MSSNFTPTQQQLDILEAFKTNKVLKINAVAGSGKTSTLELLASENTQPSLLLAFNKAIADEASKRFPSHVSCRTMNSLAYAEFGKPLQHKLNLNKNPKINTMRSLRNIVDWFKLDEYTDAEPAISARTIAAMARDALDRFCFSSRSTISEQDLFHKDFKELALQHSFDEARLSRVIVNIAKMIWKERINPISQACTTHDTYLKLWSLSNPKLNYEILYVDESQDINPCVLHVLEQQMCKIVYVGDEHQSIYGFRGAINAMKKIIAPTMHLSQSWRYGPEIADVAQMILSKQGTKVLGNPNIASKVDVVYDSKPYTMIFRTNFALIEKAEELVSEGKCVQAEVNLADIIRQIQSACALRKGDKPFHDNIARFGNWFELLDFAKESVEMQRLVKLAKRSDVDEMIENLKKVNTSSKYDVVLTTAHKSKGLEWDHVIIANDFKLGKDDPLSMPEQEQNLLYVACTRAKLTLELPLELMIVMENKE